MGELDWPDGFDRTGPSEREPYPHGFRVTRSQAFSNILDELRKMDARDVQFDTGTEHQKRNLNKPYANRGFDDPGVVVRFERDGQQFAVPYDRWDNSRDNAQAIPRYLNAKRALERYGIETVGREFATQRLPLDDENRDAVVIGTAPNQPDPHEILKVSPDASDAVVKAAARQRLAKNHPDQGGDRDEFQRVKQAKEELLDT